MSQDLISAEWMNTLLLTWYDSAKRRLPWREERSAYKVLLSELMLQQTQVSTVLPYYERFLQRWPSLRELAGASSQELREAWAGLGYYRRAENLRLCALSILNDHGGTMPQEAAELQKLPGIGAYTAAAIASMAFAMPEPAVDGNLLRVLSRISAHPWQAGREKDRKEAVFLARRLIDPERPGDWNEALMDLASMLCLPASCAGDRCPLRALCRAHAEGNPLNYPRKAKKTEKKTDVFDYLILRGSRKLYLHERRSGLLKGFCEFYIPPQNWQEGAFLSASGNVVQAFRLGELRRIFSHRIWKLSLYRLDLEAAAAALRWRSPEGRESVLPLEGCFCSPEEARNHLIPFLKDFAQTLNLI